MDLRGLRVSDGNGSRDLIQTDGYTNKFLYTDREI